MDAEEASFMTAQELMMAHIVSMALKAAMELGLIDALMISAAPAGSGGALTAAELAAQALPRPAANKAKAEDAVDRILRFLAAQGVVTCSTDGTALRRYAATPVCRWLSSSSNHGEASLAALAALGFEPALFNPWYVRRISIYMI